jgi:hypothetical protein
MFRSILTVLISSILILSVTACGGKEQDHGPGNLSGDLSKVYTEIAGLEVDASEIVEVKVTKEQEVVMHGGLPFTITTVQVLDSIKGSNAIGDEIRVIETGGKYYPVGKNNEKLKQVDLKFEGNGVMKPGQHLVLFLKRFVGPQASGVYVPLGVFQGKFMVSNGKVNQVKTKSVYLRDTKESNLEDFKTKVKSVKDKRVNSAE